MSLPRLLTDRGMTISGLGRAIRLRSPSHLSQAMYGTRSLSAERLEQIAGVLEVEPAYFPEYRRLKAVERLEQDQALADQIFDAPA